MLNKTALSKRVQGMSLDQAAQYLVNNYPVTQIAEALADYFLSDSTQVKPITISQEEFDAHFRIRGITADNQVERRGRPRKVTNPDLSIFQEDR
jgi:hypothetical protein